MKEGILATVADLHPRETNEVRTHTYNAAIILLKENTSTVVYNGKEYQRTVPSESFYTHGWKWDSETVAMGLIHTESNPQRAFDEIRAVLVGQWDNGFIPQIRYNPTVKKYYPQAEKWRTEKVRQKEVPTSGITQPPILAISVDYITQHTYDKKEADQFLDEVLPAIMKNHDNFKDTRDPENSGLLTMIHPWESGTDNSPRWDKVYKHISLERIPQSVKDDVDENRSDNKLGEASHRPTQEDYYRFMGLIDMYASWGWDYEKIVKESPFAVKDIMFSSIWARANDSLANMLERRGRSKEAEKYRGYAEQTKKALAATWIEKSQQYCDIDVSQGRYSPIIEPTNAMFMPLYAGAVTEEQLPKVLKRLGDIEQFWTEYPVPTTAINSKKFDPTRYWRGPSWPITNLLIIDGLMDNYGHNEQARQMGEHLIDTTLKMIEEYGFTEYVDPKTGKPYGFGKFSWPASIYVYLTKKYRKNVLLK